MLRGKPVYVWDPSLDPPTPLLKPPPSPRPLLTPPPPLLCAASPRPPMAPLRWLKGISTVRDQLQPLWISHRHPTHIPHTSQRPGLWDCAWTRRRPDACSSWVRLIDACGRTFGATLSSTCRSLCRLSLHRRYDLWARDGDHARGRLNVGNGIPWRDK